MDLAARAVGVQNGPGGSSRRGMMGRTAPHGSGGLQELSGLESFYRDISGSSCDWRDTRPLSPVGEEISKYCHSSHKEQQQRHLVL